MSATAISFEALLNELDACTQTPLAHQELVPLFNARGRVLAKAVNATTDMPAFTNSAMDGYAWRTRDFVDCSNSVRLPVLATVTAGHPFTEPLAEKVAIRIMTGAPLPVGFDCVLPIEKAELDGEELVINPSLHLRGENVRFAGELYKKGSILVDAGTLVTTDTLGLIASNGNGEVLCQQLRVGIFASGDELLEPEVGVEPDSAKIYNSNGIIMTELARETGATPTYLGILPDDPVKIEQRLKEALPHFDVLVCSGGVGPGDRDFTARILGKLGEMQHFHVALKPGKPFTYATLHTPEPIFFLGLPGNPVATNTTGRFFMQRVLSRLMKAKTVCRSFLVTLVERPIKSAFGRVDFIRATVRSSENGTLEVSPHAMQSSASLFGCAQSNAIIKVEAAQTHLEPGDQVEVILVD